MTTRNAVRAVVVAATALAAFGASALEFHGYFRESDGFNAKGGTQACFGLPGSDFKARLGNECDHYAEVSLSEKGTYQSVEWKYEIMPAYYQDASALARSDKLYLQQNWGGLKFNDFGGATLWAGQRYFRRHDVHSLDWFYWNPGQNNTAAGIEDVNLGAAGKLAVTLYRVDPTALVTTGVPLTMGVYMMPEIRLYDIPLYENGSLELGVDLAMASDQKVAAGTAKVDALGAKRAGTSTLFTIQHNQAKFLGGSNTLAFQYGTGALSNASGSGPGYLAAGGSSDDKQWRVIEHLVVKPTPELSGAVVLVYQDKSWAKTAAGDGAKILTAEVRPAYHVNDWFKIAADVFYQSISPKNGPSGAGTPALTKVTLAPTFALGREYYSRPELRIFATYASWNDAAAKAGTIANGAFGTEKSGTSFGAQLETWF